MNALNANVTDALTELVNMSFGVTAAKLSDISGCRILLKVPIIGVHPIKALAEELRPFVTGRAASVHQVFSGPISGDAILLLDYEGSSKVSSHVEEQLRSQLLDSSAGEILTEVGNMLLSACLGMFGNLLEVHLTFSVPTLHLNSLEDFLTSIPHEAGESQFAILITTSFKIFSEGGEAWIVIVLGESSLDRLVQAVERWEGTQVS